MHVKTLRKILEHQLIPDEARIYTSSRDHLSQDVITIYLGMYKIGFELDDGELCLINRKYWNKRDGITIKTFIRDFKLNEKKVMKAIDSGELLLTWDSDNHIKLKSAVEWLRDNKVDYSKLVTDKISYRDLERTISNTLSHLRDRTIVLSRTKSMEHFLNNGSSRASRASNLITSLIKPEVMTNMMADQCYQHLSHFHLETL